MKRKLLFENFYWDHQVADFVNSKNVTPVSVTFDTKFERYVLFYYE